MKQIKSLDVKPGSVVIYKEYNWFQKAFAKLFKKDLNFNKHKLIIESIYWFVEDNGVADCDRFVIFEPVNSGKDDALNFTLGNYFLHDENLNDLFWNENYRLIYDSKGESTDLHTTC